MKRQFKLRDRVKAIKYVDSANLAGYTGTVIRETNEDDSRIGVEFDKNITPYGHDCNGLGRDGYCRNGGEFEFELISTNVWKGKKR